MRWAKMTRQGGNLDAALTKFLEAKRTTAALLADAPNDPERIYDHAQSEYWVAFIDRRRDHLEAAHAGFERYAALAGRLIAINPANPDWQMEAGYAASNIGTLDLRDRNEPGMAEIRFANALEHFQVALRAKPEDADILSDIADGYAWLADSQLALGKFDEALANRLRQKQLLDELQAGDKNNAQYAQDRLTNALGLARIDLARGRAIQADERLTAALADATRLAAADPDNENLVTEKIAMGLFLAKAKLRDGAESGEIEVLLSQCRTLAAVSDLELRDFCAVLSAQVAASTSTIPHAAASDYLRANYARLMRTHRSPRWGIDFSRELANLPK